MGQLPPLLFLLRAAPSFADADSHSLPAPPRTLNARRRTGWGVPKDLPRDADGNDDLDAFMSLHNVCKREGLKCKECYSHSNIYCISIRICVKVKMMIV